jgi:hypothetical protein
MQKRIDGNRSAATLLSSGSGGPKHGLGNDTISEVLTKEHLETLQAILTGLYTCSDMK